MADFTLDDHRKTLGVDAKASPEDIKSAYRRLAKIHHPDANHGDKSAQDKFVKIQLAYEALKKAPSKNYEPNSQERDFRAKARTSQRAESPKPKQQTSKSDDIEIGAEVKISLEEAFSGCSKTISVEYFEKCVRCNGVGAFQVGERVCHFCNGVGRIQSSSGRPFGFLNTFRCVACLGTGVLAEVANCASCKGKGIVVRHRNAHIVIPPGVADREVLVAINHNGKKIGVRVRVLSSRRFERHGPDLVIYRNISAKRALSGTTLTFKGIDGRKLRVIVPPNTSNGDKLRLRKCGMPCFGGRGDLLISITIV